MRTWLLQVYMQDSADVKTAAAGLYGLLSLLQKQPFLPYHILHCC
jgi:hypothetical protein